MRIISGGLIKYISCVGEDDFTTLLIISIKPYYKYIAAAENIAETTSLLCSRRPRLPQAPMRLHLVGRSAALSSRASLVCGALALRAGASFRPAVCPSVSVSRRLHLAAISFMASIAGVGRLCA